MNQLAISMTPELSSASKYTTVLDVGLTKLLDITVFVAKFCWSPSQGDESLVLLPQIKCPKKLETFPMNLICD